MHLPSGREFLLRAPLRAFVVAVRHAARLKGSRYTARRSPERLALHALGHHSKLQSFRDVLGRYLILAREIRDGARDFAHAVVAPGAQ